MPRELVYLAEFGVHVASEPDWSSIVFLDLLSYVGSIGNILGLYWGNGKENGNYCSTLLG